MVYECVHMRGCALYKSSPFGILMSLDTNLPKDEK